MAALSRLAQLGRPPRVLFIFGNPLGNAFGDTVLATQHAHLMRQVFPGSEISVCTANGEIWAALAGSDLHLSPFLNFEVLTHQDLVVLDMMRPGPDLLSHLKGHILWWENPASNILVRSPQGDWQSIKVPPAINHPSRLEEAYAAVFGVTIGRAAANSGRNHDGVGRIFLNPYASTPSKSIPAQMVGSLAEALSKITAARIRISGYRPPINTPKKSADFYHEVSGILTAIGRDNIEITPELTFADYVNEIKRCDILIGPDTSSQHIACMNDIPSIVLYPAHSKWNYYFWGAQKSGIYHLKTGSEPQAQRRMIELICELSSSILRCGVRDDPEANSFSAAISGLVREGRVAIPRTTGASLSDEPWFEFPLNELTTIAAEFTSGRLEDPSIVSRRLRSINAIRILAQVENGRMALSSNEMRNRAAREAASAPTREDKGRCVVAPGATVMRQKRRHDDGPLRPQAADERMITPPAPEPDPPPDHPHARSRSRAGSSRR